MNKPLPLVWALLLGLLISLAPLSVANAKPGAPVTVRATPQAVDSGQWVDTVLTITAHGDFEQLTVTVTPYRSVALAAPTSQVFRGVIQGDTVTVPLRVRLSAAWAYVAVSMQTVGIHGIQTRHAVVGLGTPPQAPSKPSQPPAETLYPAR